MSYLKEEKFLETVEMYYDKEILTTLNLNSYQIIHSYLEACEEKTNDIIIKNLEQTEFNHRSILKVSINYQKIVYKFNIRCLFLLKCLFSQLNV